MFLFLQTLLNGLSAGANYALLAVGLSLVYGILGIANFAHGVLFATGGYAAVLLAGVGVPYYLSLPLVLGIAAVVAYLLELGVMRPILYGGSHYLAIIVTAALAQAGVAALVLLAGPNPLSLSSPLAATTLRLGPFFLSAQRGFGMIVAAAVLGMLGLWLTRTQAGRQVLAVAQNPRGALYAGINVRRVRSITFAVGAACAALAGALIGPESTVYPTMGNAALIVGFTVVIVGGMGSLRGALFAALLMGIFNAMFETYVSVRWTAALGWLVVVGVLLIRPQGLAGRVPLHRY